MFGQDQIYWSGASLLFPSFPTKAEFLNVVSNDGLGFELFQIFDQKFKKGKNK